MTHFVIGKKGWADWQHVAVQVGCNFAFFALLHRLSATIDPLLLLGFIFVWVTSDISNYRQGYNRAKAGFEEAMLHSDDNQIMLHIHESRVNKDE